MSAVSQGFTTSLLGPVRNKLDQSTSSVVFEIQGVQSGAIEEQRRGLSLVSLFFFTEARSLYFIYTRFIRVDLETVYTFRNLHAAL